MLLVLCLFSSLVTENAWAEAQTFPDAAGHWAEDYIEQLRVEDIIHGFPDGLIHPDDTVSRGEFATMLANRQKLTAASQGTATFPDIDGHWAEGSIEVLVSEGIIRKADYSENFSPDAPVTRIEMIRWLVRMLGKGQAAEELKQSTEYRDDGDVKEKDKGYVILASRYELTEGYPDHTVRPLAESTRAEAFALLCRIKIAAANIQKEGEDKRASASSPKPEIAFALPAATHTDRQVEVEILQKNADSVTWAIARQSTEKEMEPMNLDDVVEGELIASGGSIRFKIPGTYTLTATAVNGSKKTEAAQSIMIYPVAQISLTMPAISHTDSEVFVKPIVTDGDGLAVIWSLSHNGESVPINDHIDGALEDTGGTVRFTERGVYLLTASITDAAGRTYSASAPITCYPVGTAGFYLPEITHTDQTVIVETTFTELGEAAVRWTIIKDGSETALADGIEGNLGSNGGSIRFKNKGEYRLKAAWTDEGGRTYQHEMMVRVFPVPSISYALPRHAHTDDSVDVLVSNSELGNVILEWFLDNTYGFQDWSTYVEGSMTENGGSLRFKRAGVYEIVARITDATGRVFLFEQGGKIEIHPVLALDFNLPQTAHTDTSIDLRTTGNIAVLPVEWSLMRDGEAVPFSQYLEGGLTYAGGKITFTKSGDYVLIATITDALGRVFEHREGITVYPIPSMDVKIPNLLYSEEPASVTVSGTDLDVLSLVWEVSDGEIQRPLAELAEGNLTSEGGTLIFQSEETRMVQLVAKATDGAGREFYFFSNTSTLKPLASFKLSAPENGYNTDTLAVEVADTKGFEGETIQWTLTKDGNTVSAGGYDAELGNLGGSINIKGIGSFRLAGTVVNNEGRRFSNFVDIEILNRNPGIPAANAIPIRTAKPGAFLVNFTAAAADPDGDSVVYEWSGRTTDDYYTVGSHTVQVRTKDEHGAYSEWVTVPFVIANNAPSTPTISRTPNGNSVSPGTQVTIKASGSMDPEGDVVNYVWENRPAESTAYPLGKNIIRVKAVDAAGAESPWTAIVFFVADSTAGGGMTLTGPESVILENGVEGATITEVTFTVPPVSGHSGSDYGLIRGYNITTGQWDQIAYGTTRNGITLTATMDPGLYSKLEMTYYTNHDCMYNKSNITYSVTYYFE